MDAQKVQDIYLRMLYTEIEDDQSAEYGFIRKTTNFPRLTVERAARLRNLRTVLYMDMKILKNAISAEAMLTEIEAYAASPMFWQHRGRSQIEDFCLFFCEHSQAAPELKLAAKIEGVFSGLSMADDAASPWPGHQVDRAADQMSERFGSDIALVWDDFKNGTITSYPASECVLVKQQDRVKIKFSKGKTDANHRFGN